MLPVFSSMKVSAMKLLTMEGLTGAYDLDQRTTPDVVRTSKASNMLNERVPVDSERFEGFRGMRGGGSEEAEEEEEELEERGREKVGDGRRKRKAKV